MVASGGGGDPVESFLNSVQLFKNAFSPIESGIKKVAKDFEHCWPLAPKNETPGLDVKKMCAASKQDVAASVDEKKKGLLIKLPIMMFVGMFGNNDKGANNVAKKGLKEKFGVGKGDGGSCVNCLQFDVAWSLLMNGFVQAVPTPFKSVKKPSSKANEDTVRVNHVKKSSDQVVIRNYDGVKDKEENNLSFECVFGFLFDQIAMKLQKFDLGVQQHECHNQIPQPANQFDHFKVLVRIIEGKRADVNGFLGNLNFARVGGVPSSIVDVGSSTREEREVGANDIDGQDESTGNSAKSLANGLLSIPLSNVERLRSTLSTVSITELIELFPQLGRSSKDHPDKKKLISVQDFFRYTEAEGKRFFEELDRDGDGQVTLEDLEVAMRKRKLPKRYAHELMHRARSHLFSKSFGWKQFLSLMEQKESTILRAYTSLCLSKSGTLQKSEILASLNNAGLPANEDNAIAMMRFLSADAEESISYGHFRNFMLLLPSDRLQEDPRNIWFEAATVVAVPPPVEIPAGSVLKSALAGGLSCALSTSLMHPVDTIKTQVQASTLTFPQIISKLPELGARGLYRGSIPAIVGQFSSHGLRTGIFEASKVLLINIAPTLPELQVQSVASFCSTFLGTAVRIPCEVLKQRLQAGLFDNVGAAIIGTWQQDGLKGFFRGTGATLCREIPFYVVGMGLYAESKKAVQQLLGRELEPWETVAVGALSGGLTAVLTTPFDVIKTRMMTAPQGRSVTSSMVALSILHHEGPVGLFKGAIPRFFWIAPLGAMNFAGYELARKAMDKDDTEQLAQKSG
ncbi:mitochondrial substrate carrier family protein C [Capsicum chacoense]